jgi:hypothetical protein
MSSHPIVHVEISGHNPSASADFYTDIFGWKIECDPNFPDYPMFDGGTGPGGGFTKIDNEMYKPGDVVVYIATDDIEATLTKIEATGGKTLLPKTEIPHMGWFAFFADPGGTRIGLYTSMNPG